MNENANVPTYKKAREDAGIELEVGLEDLLDEPITVTEWKPDARVLPQTRKTTQGYLMQGVITATGEAFYAFVGASVLVKELTALRPPFSTVIRRSGQTYRFS